MPVVQLSSSEDELIFDASMRPSPPGTGAFASIEPGEAETEGEGMVEVEVEADGDALIDAEGVLDGEPMDSGVEEFEL